MQNDNRNFIVFAVLAVLLLFGWPLVMNRVLPPANPPVSKVENGKTQAQPNTNAPSPTTAAKAQDLTQVLKGTAGQRVVIDTPTLKGSINLKGARIDDLVLSQYKETIDKNSPPIRLLSPDGTPDGYFAEFGWATASAPTPDTVWAATGTVLAPGKPVTLTADTGQGQRFRIDLAVDDQYMFTIRQSVANATGAPIAIQPYGLVKRAHPSKDMDTWTIQVGPMSVHNGAADYDLNYADVGVKATSKWSTNAGWLGFTDKYWLTALIPDQGAAFDGTFQQGKDKQGYQAAYVRNAATVAPGTTLTQTSHFFAGAKEVRLLDQYEDQLKIAHFGRGIDWGWFEIIEKPIFTYLDWLFRMIGNFGVAIMLLTLTIRLLIFPIAQRQFASMAAMRAVQPKMKALQEKYKDDKQRQQQEVMALYKSEGVNPLAGCLPTLLQIPIMYSLYKVLMLTIEMRHKPFVGWIHDLSAPDPATIVNLFGYLHFTPPSFLAIGVVPVLLGGSMWLQFKMNPQPMDEAQKQVFAFMPWILMFVMAPFAVGLQVYWITSNLLTVLQQKVLYARHPVLKTAAAK